MGKPRWAEPHPAKPRGVGCSGQWQGPGCAVSRSHTRCRSAHCSRSRSQSPATPSGGLAALHTVVAEHYITGGPLGSFLCTAGLVPGTPLLDLPMTVQGSLFGDKVGGDNIHSCCGMTVASPCPPPRKTSLLGNDLDFEVLLPCRQITRDKKGRMGTRPFFFKLN